MPWQRAQFASRIARPFSMSCARVSAVALDAASTARQLATMNVRNDPMGPSPDAPASPVRSVAALSRINRALARAALERFQDDAANRRRGRARERALELARKNLPHALPWSPRGTLGRTEYGAEP